MINNRLSNLKMFCDDYTNIENYDLAITDMEHTWHCHHRLEIGPNGERVSRQDLISHGLYYHRPASELIFLTCSDHLKLHKSGNSYGRKNKGRKHSFEARKNMSEAHKGKPSSHLGHRHSEETRKKMSEAIKRYFEQKRKMTKE